ncbi:hypothetical protein QE152_g19243 [Popillia japonica]|uniref:Integrase catalytic domain-containing protein n=1 Tax=Popillia japonica TaxID=7064 RepID=A0AAW1KRL9_POPJA
MKQKSEVKKNLEKYINLSERETGHKMKTLRTDNGLEFLNADIKEKIYFMKQKSEVKKNLEKYINLSERETGHKMKTLRTDNGLEFLNADIKEILESRGIKHQRTVMYTNLESDESSIESSQYNDNNTHCISAHTIAEVYGSTMSTNTRYNLRRERKRNTKYDDYEMDVDNVLMIKSDDDDEPLCYDDAASSSDWKQWKKAMEEEISALNENDTWFCVQKGEVNKKPIELSHIHCIYITLFSLIGVGFTRVSVLQQQSI